MIVEELTKLTEEIADKLDRCLSGFYAAIYRLRVDEGIARLWRIEENGVESYCLFEVRPESVHIVAYQGSNCVAHLQKAIEMCAKKGLRVTADIHSPAMLRLIRRVGMLPVGA